MAKDITTNELERLSQELDSRLKEHLNTRVDCEKLLLGYTVRRIVVPNETITRHIPAA